MKKTSSIKLRKFSIVSSITFRDWINVYCYLCMKNGTFFVRRTQTEYFKGNIIKDIFVHAFAYKIYNEQ